MTTRADVHSFVIEKGVPIPPEMQMLRPRLCYPFDQMDVGDSFFVAFYGDLNRVHTAAVRAARSGKKFTTRTEGTGFRVWRIA